VAILKVSQALKNWARIKATEPPRRPATDPKGKYAYEEAQFWINEALVEIMGSAVSRCEEAKHEPTHPPCDNCVGEALDDWVQSMVDRT
jgi:hypothetical protein